MNILLTSFENCKKKTKLEITFVFSEKKKTKHYINSLKLM